MSFDVQQLVVIVELTDEPKLSINIKESGVVQSSPCSMLCNLAGQKLGMHFAIWTVATAQIDAVYLRG